MTPHIAIIGSALSGNKGASAMLETSLHTLRERLPGVRFTLLSMYPIEDRAQNDNADLKVVAADPFRLGVVINSLALLHRVAPLLRGWLERRFEVLAALRSADVLLDQGGITFSDGREKFLLYNVASILPALNLGVPVIKCAQAVGPFESRLNRWVASVFLPRIDRIVTRGRITHELAEGLGLTNLVAGADYAFALPLSGNESEHAAAYLDLDIFLDEVVGLSPSVVLDKKVRALGGDYVTELVKFIDALGDRGQRVLLVAHSARTGTNKMHNNDLPLCRHIAARARRPELVSFVDREVPSQVLRYLIGRCDTFVASRFHAMVSSLAMGVPTLVIGWSHKYEEVLEMFDLQRWAFGHQQLTGEFLLEQFDQLNAQKEPVRRQIAERLPQVRALATAQADLIAQRVQASSLRESSAATEAHR